MQEKINKRKKYYLMVDTETCNGIVVNDKLDLSNSFVYDIGFAVVDKQGNIYTTGSYLIVDIFCGEGDLMSSAYYAEKIPNYWKDVKEGKRQVTSFYNARLIIKNVMEQYNITTVVAHNAPFDITALNNTQRWLTKSKYRYFFPFGTEIYCTLAMARSILPNKKGYLNYCKREGYITQYGKPRMTAEIIYKYLTGNYDFIESHTGLEDVLIESEIFRYCMNQHGKVNKNAYRKK